MNLCTTECIITHYFTHDLCTVYRLGECIALWVERKQVLLCGRCWCTFVCKCHNSKRVVLRRLRSNPQSLADPESSQSASALGLCRRRIADFDALAVALICYTACGRLPSYSRMLLLSPAFPPISHCVTCNRLGRTGIWKPTKVCGCVNLVCGGFKHIYIYAFASIPHKLQEEFANKGFQLYWIIYVTNSGLGESGRFGHVGLRQLKLTKACVAETSWFIWPCATFVAQQVSYLLSQQSRFMSITWQYTNIICKKYLLYNDEVNKSTKHYICPHEHHISHVGSYIKHVCPSWASYADLWYSPFCPGVVLTIASMCGYAFFANLRVAS